MRHEGEIRIAWSRAELTALREAVELTPNFEGRIEVRDMLRGAMRARNGKVVFERETAERFARRLVAIDLPTALAKVKLLTAIQDADRLATGGVTPTPAPASEHAAAA
ncbi:MAG TPA: hypothetical protein VFO26_06945 [Gaiella sp.]|uniref:hypothetical protein n=1 Tax=Gaiella sp. TaxID=2663207 RepID=UPI002D7FB39E|nr:hypothetical protein [Gaiella sp.]HET9287279.1 hypothetical protein [Gaiella sp.]